MQLRRLAALERQEIIDEYDEAAQDDRLPRGPAGQPAQDPLSGARRAGGAEEEVRRCAADAGRQPTTSGDISDEDLIPNIEVLVTISGRGYIKRLPLGHLPRAAARRQGHQGHGAARRGCAAPHGAWPTRTTTSSSSPTAARVFQLKAHDIPEADRTAKGLPMVNLIEHRPAARRSRRCWPRRTSSDHFLIDGDAPGRDQEDPAPGLRRGALERPDRDRPRGRTTSWPGSSTARRTRS